MPSFEYIEAFSAAANGHSFRAAAASLALSPSAFSRRIQQLERFVGTELFHRTGGQTQLTAAGRDYFFELEPAIETIRAATITLRARHDERRVRIASSHSLTSEWLLPRLPSLLAEHGVEVEIEISRDARLVREGVVELGIWGGGGGTVPGLVSHTIAPMAAVPVCAARLADGRRPPETLDQLGEHRLLTDRVSRWLWPHWLSQAGYRGARPRIIDHFETNQLCNEAAASGLGVALCLPLVAERFIDSGRLLPCAPVRVHTGAAYQVHLSAENSANHDTTSLVLNWLQSEASTSLRRFDEWWSRQGTSLDPALAFDS
ncbi:MAG: hypothetical protein CVT77_01290 [Alphaproteobacteria bacterium HGW-Alphaproteobacteria-16]|nr:MAG: hypothetical protein CVT77_01290 [Alphaproteobacteria bacterium HGW-Alphaproteobacteria-16]